MLLNTILASYAYFREGSIGDMFARWEEMGIFSYILPFLLIFALVNGILTRTGIFKDNKPVNAIISLAVGFMALQFDLVPQFFSELFSKFAIGLTVILVFLILGGLFLDPDDKGLMYVMLGIGTIIIIVVLVLTAGALDWTSGYFWQDNWIDFAVLIVFLIVVAMVVAPKSDSKPTKSILAEALRGR